MSEDHGPSPDEMYRAVNADWLDAIEAGINPYTGRKMNRETTDETTDIIETIRDRRDRAIDAHGRTAAAMDVMHLSPFEQAVYVDAALERIDRLTAERDVAYAELSRVRYAIDRLTAERDQALHRIEQLYASTVSQGVHDKMVDLYNRAIDERNAARAEVKRLRNAVWSAYSDLHAHLYVATNMEGGRLFSAYETLRANYTAIRAALGSEEGE